VCFGSGSGLRSPLNAVPEQADAAKQSIPKPNTGTMGNAETLTTSGQHAGSGSRANYFLERVSYRLFR